MHIKATFIILAIIILAGSGCKDIQEQKTTAEPADQAQGGLNITRSEIINGYSAGEDAFNWSEGNALHGNPNWIGINQGRTIQVVGSDEQPLVLMYAEQIADFAAEHQAALARMQEFGDKTLPGFDEWLDEWFEELEDYFLNYGCTGGDQKYYRDLQFYVECRDLYENMYLNMYIADYKKENRAETDNILDIYGIKH